MKLVIIKVHANPGKGRVERVIRIVAPGSQWAGLVVESRYGPSDAWDILSVDEIDAIVRVET